MDVDPLAPLLRTRRLELRNAALSDSSFFLKLLNDPSWLANIGDRGVRSQADAEAYLRNTVWAQYEAFGYGMYVVQLRSTAVPIGICGLVKRDFLPAPDLGFALLPEHVSQGYALEAARAVVSHAEASLQIGRLYAIAKSENHRSVRLLDRLGFRHEGPLSLPRGGEVELYARS